ncbi:hypothetical protein N7516_007346 [Penicillium verrucosum]|uniref:uncharacterized protein n=1 Tax=Penicillium verrucosum TaxID=60171 RepID=UPI002545AC54|nr:uncharacterized protein N7516_007346 [Penicillium verrucosum]KAJ5932857.1 hypothetical protein N7516_007346 [Penicillium verrucosum]
MAKSEKEKKKALEAKDARRNARDIQTPAPTEVGSESESQQAESSRAQELIKAGGDKKGKTPERTRSESPQAESSRAQELIKAGGDKKGKTPERTRSESPQAESSRAQELIKAGGDKKGKTPEPRRQYARSPTRAGDFAPNASDYESDGETDLDSDYSDQDVPMEDKLQPLSRWVKDVIRSEALRESGRMVEGFFTSDNPSYEECSVFFQRLNQKVRGANDQHDVMDLDTGTIPETGYNALCQAFQQAAKKAVDNSSPEEFWEAYNNTYDLLTRFNKRHCLPKSWNISELWAENWIGSPNPRIRIDEDTSSTSDSDIQAGDIQADKTSEESSAESDIDIDSDHQPTGLDALEVRTNKQQRQLNSAKVLYWWPKGTGSQIFVRYGSRSTPIYRIRAGSHESYNPSQVERVLTMLTRGTAKVTGTKNGLPEEFWKYQRRDVEDLVGIGWKVEEDDEQGLNPLNLLLPAKDIVYPQTRILVKWKDGRFTLEGRSFIRRITTGSALDGDRVIYQRAEELEDSYRKKHGLFDIEDDDFEDDDFEDDDINTESDSSTQSNKARNRRHRSEPARYSNPRSQSSRHRSEPARYSSPHSQSSRHRSEPARSSNPRSQSSRHRSEPARSSNPRSQSSKHRSEPARSSNPRSQSSRHRSEPARSSNLRSQSSRHRSEPARSSNPRSQSSKHRSEPARSSNPHSQSSKHRSEPARSSNLRSQSSRHRSEPARSSNPRSQSSKHRSEPARYSSPHSQSSRHRSEPARHSHSRRKQSPTQFEDSTDEDSDVVRNPPASERPRKVRWIR